MDDDVCIHGHTMATECPKCNKLLVTYLKRLMAEKESRILR